MPQKPWPWSWVPARNRKAKGPRACKAFGQTLGDGHGERFPVVFYECVLFVSKVFVRYLQGTALIKSLIKRGLVLACALYLDVFSWLTPPEPRDLGVTFRTETTTISNHQGGILGYIFSLSANGPLLSNNNLDQGRLLHVPASQVFFGASCVSPQWGRGQTCMPRLVAEEAVSRVEGMVFPQNLCGASWSHNGWNVSVFPHQFINFPKKNSDDWWAPAGFVSCVLKDFERVLNWLWQCSVVDTQVPTLADMCGIVNPCQSAFRGLGFPQYPYAPYLPTLRPFMGCMFANIPYITWSIWGSKDGLHGA